MKRKRLLSVILAVTMCMGMADTATALYIGPSIAISYENGNEEKSFNENGSGDGWSYDYNTNTLILNNFRGESICSEDDREMMEIKPFTIQLAEGSVNSVDSIGFYTDVIIKGNGILEIRGQKEGVTGWSETYLEEGTIKIAGKIENLGTSLLHIRGGDVIIEQTGLNGPYTSIQLDMTGGNLNFVSEKNNSIPIPFYDGEITGGTLTAFGYGAKIANLPEWVNIATNMNITGGKNMGDNYSLKIVEKQGTDLDGESWKHLEMPDGSWPQYVCITDSKQPVTSTQQPVQSETPAKQEELQTDIGEYIYDVQDPAEDMALPTDMLDKVKDINSAVKATEETVKGMTEEQKQSATGIDLATLSAETATARAAAKPVSGNEIIIDKTSVSDLQAVAAQTSTAVENTLISGGVTPERTLSKTVTLTSDSTDELSIRIEPDILTSGVDKVRVETPSCALTFKISDLEADLTKPLTVTLQELGSDTENVSTDTTMTAGVRNFAEGYETVDMGISDISVLANPVKKVKVNFPGGKMTNAVTVSLPSGGGDKTYQAVVKDGGKATASKYNPATTAIDGKINTSGTYTVQTNQKNFTDIANKSAEMQKAIRYLASKGIINGTTETSFSPDQTISRAQIASLMVQALGKMDNSATANFTDVPKNAWYYHQAASSQKHGLFSGYEDNTFRGGNVIQKDQLVNVAGNVLVKEMGYKAPGNPSAYLSKYSDNVAGWAQPMVALATKENLVVYRTNGTFGGKGTMTRGDAAIIIYRLFMKIW